MSLPFILCCRLPYKGTNFSANHNENYITYMNKEVVDYLTKVQISQQITTIVWHLNIFLWLSITLQRYKFLSKSQRVCGACSVRWVVDYLTKVQISQQITTEGGEQDKQKSLSITLQRYKFLSKSQLSPSLHISRSCCRLPYKGTNFSANHNGSETPNHYVYVVDYLTKVQISQQITTIIWYIV